MQNHSGEHIISGIVNSLYGYDNVGFHLSDSEMTMDFNGVLTREDLLKVEKLANELLARETLTGDEIREIVNGKATKKTATKQVTTKTKTNAKK